MNVPVTIVNVVNTRRSRRNSAKSFFGFPPSLPLHLRSFINGDLGDPSEGHSDNSPGEPGEVTGIVKVDAVTDSPLQQAGEEEVTTTVNML